MIGDRSTVIARSPLRVSFVGGGSDLRGGDGRTISTAIDKYVYAVVRRRRDDRVILHWRQREDVDCAASLNHAIAREILVREGLLHGVEIVTIADVPGVGSGLGSSAATTCAILSGVMALKGMPIYGQELAESAADIEVSRLGGSCGKQDHYASALGNLIDVSWSDGECRWLKVLPSTDSQLKKLAEWFPLFSERGSSGRSAERVLAKVDDGPEWRVKCEDLAADWALSWECWRQAFSVSHFEHLGDLVAEHHEVKQMGFPRYVEDGCDVGAKLSRLSRYKLKLCGAGAGGHLLVHAPPCMQEEVHSVVSDVWGPRLPWSPVKQGTQILYEE